MDTIFIKTPLGIAKIEGDITGIAVISVQNDGQISETIPQYFLEAVSQLNEYFDGKRKDFTFKLSPKGTDFQKKYGRLFLKSHMEKQCPISNCLKNWVM